MMPRKEITKQMRGAYNLVKLGSGLSYRRKLAQISFYINRLGRKLNMPGLNNLPSICLYAVLEVAIPAMALCALGELLVLGV